ncbi:hypothetical protein ACWC5F_24340 [Streptomyces sp. NPDC001272]|uniref:hypothetical protein n=1 Tax=unclassified Streptomyces TaxID=2593676 RepID=UPI0033270093
MSNSPPQHSLHRPAAERFHNHLLTTAHMPPWLADRVVEIRQLVITRPESPNDIVKTVLSRSARTLHTFTQTA